MNPNIHVLLENNLTFLKNVWKNCLTVYSFVYLTSYHVLVVYLEIKGGVLTMLAWVDSVLKKL